MGMQQQMMSGTMMIRSDPGFCRVDFKSGEALGNCDGMAVAVGEGVGICEGAGEGANVPTEIEVTQAPCSNVLFARIANAIRVAVKFPEATACDRSEARES